MSLRLRLILAVAGLTAAGLLAVGAITYTLLRSALYAQVGQQLRAAHFPVVRALMERPGAPPSHTLGLVGRHIVPRPSRPGAVVSTLPPGTVGEFVSPAGRVLGRVTFSYQGPGPAPRLPRAQLAAATTAGRTFGAVGGRHGSVAYRVLVQRIPGHPGALVTAIPLTTTDETLGQLVLIELLASAAVLAGVILAAGWAVRRSLRPLETIAATAAAIAEGDLSRRVTGAGRRTEVGRVAEALNTMLQRIESAFAERRASEDRLRRFLADASHELRTPLTSIRGYAELFRRGAASRPQDLAKSLRRIEEEARRMGLLVDDLLLLARLDSGRPLEMRPVDLVRLAGDAVTDLRVVDPERPVELEAPAGVTVLGDEARLRQVLTNLLDNARRHTRPRSPVAVGLRADADEAVLEVRDQGPGLSPGAVRHIFEPFYRADPARERTTGGAGLGLAIVAALIRAHEGRVEVDSALGAGSTFRVRLQLAPAVPSAGTDPWPARARPRRPPAVRPVRSPGTAETGVPAPGPRPGSPAPRSPPPPPGLGRRAGGRRAGSARSRHRRASR
ncbi:MAG TPA: HAMP domain-containing sensor histidine kinase [Candidatus Micrarchaeia archaeon]|nr:HAMP domain-containing sensor histidine kinase [Candidatus Micrarchaeia archaeon]